MSYHSILLGEVSSLIDELIEQKAVINPDSVTSEICANHRNELNGDAPFSTFNNHSNVRREVRRVMSKKMEIPTSAEGEQLTIEGHKYVQRYYSIQRVGQQIGIPVEEMTSEEIESKAEELIKMGKACFAHAKELKRYFVSKSIA